MLDGRTEFDIFIQFGDGCLIPTYRKMDIVSWELKYEGKFRFDQEHLFNRNKYYAFVEVDSHRKLRIMADLVDLLPDVH